MQTRAFLLASGAGRAVMVAMLAGLMACSDSTAPDGPGGGQPVVTPGFYVLISANGAPLPAVVFDGFVGTDEDRFHLRVLALDGVLELKADGRYEHQIRHEVHVDGVFSGRPRVTDRGPYQASAATIHFTSEVVSNVSFTAVRGPNRMDIVRDHLGEGQAVSYRYVNGVIAF